MARPTLGAPATDQHVPPPLAPIESRPGRAEPARRHAAETFGKYALCCTLLALALFGTFMAVAIGTAVQVAASQPSGIEDRSSIEQEMQSRLLDKPWLIAMEVGGIFFALVGLSLGIVSLIQAPRANSRGTLSVIACSLMLLCVCTSAIVSMATGLGT